MIRNICFDLDDTLLDFRQAERAALTEVLTDFGISVTDALPARYAAINAGYWKRLERGELTRDDLKQVRFCDLFRESGITDVSPAAVSEAYEARLGRQYFLIPQAKETLEKLRGSYRLFAASNGTGSIQRARLAGAGIDRFFEGIFLSGEIGVQKPSAAFFDCIFLRFPELVRSETVMIGDSLSSDITGGKRAGLRTVLFAPAGQNGSVPVQPDATVRTLPELETVLKTL